MKDHCNVLFLAQGIRRAGFSTLNFNWATHLHGLQRRESSDRAGPVVGDVKQLGVSQPSKPEMYRPYAASADDPVAAHETSFATTIVIRSRNNPLTLASAVRQQVAKLDPNLPVFDIATMEQRLGSSLATPRFNAVLVGIFGGFALLLAVLGVYGLISYFVSHRMHEIGIRMALGALPTNILHLVMREGLAITGLGMASGLAVCIAADLLFQIQPTDPLTIAAVSMVLGLVALQASYLPARRAVKVDPMAALRHE